MEFCGKTVLKSDMLAGAKGIVYTDGKYYASPAIYSLLKSEKGPDLKHLVLHLKVFEIENLDDLPEDIFHDLSKPKIS